MTTHCRTLQILEPEFSSLLLPGLYEYTIDALRDTDTALDNYETAMLSTGAKLDIIMGDPAAESTWQLQVGTADPAYPALEVAALNSSAGAPVRKWVKVGGY